MKAFILKFHPFVIWLSGCSSTCLYPLISGILYLEIQAHRHRRRHAFLSSRPSGSPLQWSRRRRSSSAVGSSHEAPSLTLVHGGDDGALPSAGDGSSPLPALFHASSPYSCRGIQICLFQYNLIVACRSRDD